jgi:hypothetical protein
MSETLMADAQASFVIGEWEDAVPSVIASGQAAEEKGNLLLVSQSLAYRAIIATAKGDHRAASELVAAIPLSSVGDQSLNEHAYVREILDRAAGPERLRQSRKRRSCWCSS